MSEKLLINWLEVRVLSGSPSKVFEEAPTHGAFDVSPIISQNQIHNTAARLEGGRRD